MIDIAVVGGGPGGLAAAVAAKIARPKLRVAVFERSAALDPPRGAVLAVVPNGVKALHAIDPSLCLSVKGLDLGVKGVRIERKDGAVLFEDASGRRADRAAHIGPSSICTWHGLRKTLALRAQELGVELVLGSAFEGFEQVESGDGGDEGGFVRLRFSAGPGGGGGGGAEEARLLIGADGSRSRVRSQIVRQLRGGGGGGGGNGEGSADGGDGDGDEPVYSGTAAWRGTLSPPLPESFGERTKWGWLALVGDPADSASPRVATYPVRASKLLLGGEEKETGGKEGGGAEPKDGDGGDDDDLCLVWQLFCRFPEERLSELSSRLHYAGDAAASDASSPSSQQQQKKKIERALEALGEGWPRFLTEAVEKTDPSQIAEHGIFYREADEAAPWGSGRVTLVGDAAHLATPMLGQGSSAAFEDALALGHELKREDRKVRLDASLLRRYEQKRIPRATAIQRASVDLYKRQGRGEKVDEIGEHLKLGFLEEEFESL